jgi:hypothetical protein
MLIIFWIDAESSTMSIRNLDTDGDLGERAPKHNKGGFFPADWLSPTEQWYSGQNRSYSPGNRDPIHNLGLPSHI